MRQLILHLIYRCQGRWSREQQGNVELQIELGLVWGQASLVAQMVKNLLQWGRPGFVPWVGKIPWRREWLPTPVLLPGEFQGQRSLAGYSPWDRKESDPTVWLTFLHFLAWKNPVSPPSGHLHEYSWSISASILWILLWTGYNILHAPSLMS